MAIDDLESVGVGDRDMIGSQTNHRTILLVYFVDMLTALPLGSPIAQPSVGEFGDPGPWDITDSVRIE